MGKELSKADEEDDINVQALIKEKPSPKNVCCACKIPKYITFQNAEDFKFDILESLPPNINENKNYGLCPLSVLHNVFQFVDIKEVNNLMRSCSLFYSIINTQFFWKEMCITRKLVDEKDLEKKPVKNWKLEYFTHFFSKDSDENYKKKYELDRTSTGIPFKVCLLGATKSGKTSLTLRWVRDQFHEKMESTIGASFMTTGMKRLSDDFQVKFEIWDSAGQERFFSLLPMYYRSASVVVFVFSLNNQESFDYMKEKLLKTVNKDCIDKNFLVFGTKCDLERKVKRSDINKLLKEYPRVFSYVELSSKTNLNVFTSLCVIFEVLSNVEQKNNEQNNTTACPTK